MAEEKGEYKVKLAVTYEKHHEKTEPFMGEYDSSRSLEEFIQILCEHWSLTDPSCYMLQFSTEPQHYVCDANKLNIKKGVLLHLQQSAPLLVISVLSTLSKPQADKKEAVNCINKFATDPTFVMCFVERQGLDTLQRLVLEMSQEEPLMALIIQAFTDLLNTVRGCGGLSQFDWENCNEKFVQKITMLVESQLGISESLLQSAVKALDCVVRRGGHMHALVDQGLSLLRLMQHLSTVKEEETRYAVLLLVISLFAHAAPDRRQVYHTKLSDRSYRTLITDNVLSKLTRHSVDAQHPSDATPVADLRTNHALHRLQQLLLNTLQPRLLSGVAPDDSSAAQKILDLRNVAFDADTELTGGGSARREEIKKEYKKLGFRNDNPAHDFNEVPPGVLALDNIHYFCHHRPDQYSKLVLENCYRADSHECPIGKASIELTKLLAKILKIGEPPHDNSPDFHPMLFTNDHPFEELFCICISLLNKTWKEMKATTEDFSKVLRVVQEQIVRALRYQPPNLDQFQKRLQDLTYKDITDCWQRERKNLEEQEMKAPQIQKLKDVLRLDIRDVVQQQRLRILEEGEKFRNPQRKGGREKYFYCRLSPNHKFFHHNECDEKASEVPTLDNLTKKISVADIKSIAIGKDCPNYNNRRRNQFAFSLMLESSKTEAVSLDFAANDEETFNIWQDGVKVLLRENMCSEAAERDINMLLDMEVKLQLLDVEGVTIPATLPPLPPLPSNYNFCYNL